MTAIIAWLERHQIALYLASIVAGGLLGVGWAPASHLEATINPGLGVLLYATFLGVPFASIGAALRDGRFLAAVIVVNFAVVPVVAFALSRVVADRPALLFGVLLDWTGIRSSAFMLLYGVVWVSLIWMYFTEVRRTDVLNSHGGHSDVQPAAR